MQNYWFAIFRMRELCRKQKWRKPSVDRRALTINKSLTARGSYRSFHGSAWAITKYLTISPRCKIRRGRPDALIWIIQRARPKRERERERANHWFPALFFCLQLAHRDIHRVLFCCSLTHSSPISLQVPASATSPSPRSLRDLLSPCHHYSRIFRVVISSTRRRRSPFATSPIFRSLEPPSFHSSSLSPAPPSHFVHCPRPRHRLAPRRRRRPSSRTIIVSQRSVSCNFITPLSWVTFCEKSRRITLRRTTECSFLRRILRSPFERVSSWQTRNGRTLFSS